MTRFKTGEVVRPTSSVVGDLNLIGVITRVTRHANGIESLDEYHVQVGLRHQSEVLAFELEKAAPFLKAAQVFKRTGSSHRSTGSGCSFRELSAKIHRFCPPTQSDEQPMADRRPP